MRACIYAILALTTVVFFYGVATEEITPYKFSDEERKSLYYEIPFNSRFTTKRANEDDPEIVYYLSQPHKNAFPIAILCGGSSDKEHIESSIHFHRYFLQEFLDMGVGVITLEQWGVDGNLINAEEFMEHYTRSQRLNDHCRVIDNLIAHPPECWNGKFIFLGVSEGGPIVTKLTQEYDKFTLATVNWSGAGDWSWEEELWVFLQKLNVTDIKCPHLVPFNDCFECMEWMTSKTCYLAQIHNALENPSPKYLFLNMTLKYHADAMLFPKVDYQKIQTPFLVVAGAQDTIIQSCDEFVRKANRAHVDITYFRVEDMDHYIRKRPEIIQRSFDWLQNQLKACIQQNVICGGHVD